MPIGHTLNGSWRVMAQIMGFLATMCLFPVTKNKIIIKLHLFFIFPQFTADDDNR